MEQSRNTKLSDSQLHSADETALRAHYETLLKEYESEVGISTNGRINLDPAQAYAAQVDNYVTVVQAVEATEGYALFESLTDAEITRVVDGSLAVGFGPPDEHAEQGGGRIAAAKRRVIGELLRLAELETETIDEPWPEVEDS